MQRREDSNRSMENFEIWRTKSSNMNRNVGNVENETRRNVFTSLENLQAFGRLRSSAENWRVRGLEESLRASLQAQAEMKEIHDEELERSRDSTTRTSDHLRSIQNRVDSLRRQVRLK